MLSRLFLHPLGLVSLSFIHCPTLPLLCVSPLCCHYLRLSRGFLSFLLFHVCCGLLRFSLYSTSFSFAAVSGFPSWFVSAYYAFARVCFPCFFSSFFLALFPLGASRLRFRRYFCLFVLLFA